MRKDKMRMKKILAFLLTFLLCFGGGIYDTVPAKAQGESSSVIVSVEKFTLGKGWITEPEVVPLLGEETVSSLLTRYMEQKGYPLIVNTNTSYGWYLSGITRGDAGGDLQIPDLIKEMADKDNKNLTDTLTNKYAPDLNEFSYASADAGTETSGWMYSVNNDFPGTSMESYTLKNKDVLRIQFTLYGTGLDVSGESPGGNVYDRADKSELFTRLAYINQAMDSWLSTEQDQNAYDHAVETAQKLNATQKEVDQACSALPDQAVVWPESILLSDSSLTLYENDPVTALDAKVYPKNTSFPGISWDSSDVEVASVTQKGRITPHKAGTAMITAMTQNGIRESCAVTVIQRPYTSIRLNKTALSMEAGDTYRLEASGTPENATEPLQITWGSSDSSIAEVSGDGVVTAVSQGTVAVTAQQNGTDIQAACQVTVGDAKELALQAQALIEALPKAGTLTIEDVAEVWTAQDSWESLSDTSKSYLDNSKVLEQKLSRCLSVIQTLTKKYENVNRVASLIEKLPSLSALSMTDRKAVEDAADAYDALKTEEKILVDAAYKKRLEKARSRMEEMVTEVKETKELLASIPNPVTLQDTAAVIAPFEKYESLDEIQKEQLSQGLVQRLMDALDTLPFLITEAVNAIDISASVRPESLQIQTFLQAVAAYDELKDSLAVSEETTGQMEQIKTWIGTGIHAKSGVSADSYWYIQTHAREPENLTEVEKALKKKYTNAKAPSEAWEISYTDIRDQSCYKQERNIALTFSCKDLAKMENPQVFYYSGNGLKKLKPQMDLGLGTALVKTNKSGLFVIADVPIPITGLDMKNMCKVTKGSTLALAPKKIPDDATSKVEYVWESSDASIVSVDGKGNVTGKKAGTAVVTASVKGQAKIKAKTKVTVVTTANSLSKSIKEVIKETAAYAKSTDQSPTLGSEWYVISQARNGMDLNDTYFSVYYNHLANYLKQKNGVLSESAYTEYSKVILAVTAIGKDARNVAGYNLFKPLADFEQVKNQGLNGPIWALIALKSYPDYQIPQISGVAEQTTEKKLLDFILGRQLKDGGWALSGRKADSDMTGMALQSLSPFYNKSGYEDVTKAVNQALDCLGSMQTKTGGYITMGVETSESTAQVITALTSLGIDPKKDTRFVKNGAWTVQNLISYHIGGSGFMHVKAGSGNNGGAAAGEVDGLATGQGFYSLVAYQRLLDGKTALYDMSDLAVKPGGTGDGSGTGLEQAEMTMDIVQGGGRNASGDTSGSKSQSPSTASSRTTDGNAVKKPAAAKKNEQEKTAKKKADEKKPWSFDGSDYKPKTKVLAKEKDTKGKENVPAATNAVLRDDKRIFSKAQIPYVLCLVCGCTVVGVCIYFKKRI
ncbi:Ig-like domain-containing protein [Blautia liquoris]|uniref:Ig-like domain-containing protein n=1 Tax=Blautia liquoris TaxID=2779518 RepID=A0A7M2RES6_9FIRM|nr:Ig-like domain-containing protein [Blautia liquoris]QOV18087.1 Ig-like domain-containing protein [Blautia liquoris]